MDGVAVVTKAHMGLISEFINDGRDMGLGRDMRLYVRWGVCPGILNHFVLHAGGMIIRWKHNF